MRKAIFFSLLAISIGVVGAPDETCCPERDIAMKPVPMPAGQKQDLSNFYMAAVLHPLHWDAIDSIDKGCPEISIYDLEAKAESEDLMVKIDAAVRKQKGWPPDPSPWKPPPPENSMDYLFEGTLVADQITGTDLSGNLEGKFTFRLRMLDHHHEQILKEGSTSWVGDSLDGGNKVEKMAESFRPLIPLMKKYERIAEKARVDMPKNRVMAGKTEMIMLSEMLDKEGQPTQWWQRLFVHIEKGKILNAEEIVDFDGKQYHIFRAGREGTVRVQYQAPDACEDDRETLTVFNCCEKREPPAFMNLRPRTEIAKKTFDIDGNCWDFTITYLEDITMNEKLGNTQLQAARKYSMKLSGRIFFKEQHPNYVTFNTDSASLELTDTLNRHDTFEGKPPSNTLGTYSGQAAGAGFASVWLEIPRKNQEAINFGWSDLQKPVTYKGTCQWWGFPNVSDGAAEFTAQTLMALNNQNAIDEIPEEALAYAQGQTVLRGEHSWQDMGTLVGTGGPFELPFEDEEIKWTRQPPLGAVSLASPMSPTSSYHHTIKWEFRMGKK